MHKGITIIVSLLAIMSIIPFEVFADDQFCADAICKKLQALYDKEKYEKIVEIVDHGVTYSEGSIFYIGRSHIIIAEKKELPSEREQLYRRALKFKYYPAYMALYSLYSDKAPKIALEFVKKYIETNPDDPDPYFILGEVEFRGKKYNIANKYLRKSKKLSRGHTAGLDWLLFKVNYILGNYKYASKMLESAFAQGQFVEELKALKTDPRFNGVEKHPEFKEYRQYFRGK